MPLYFVLVQPILVLDVSCIRYQDSYVGVCWSLTKLEHGLACARQKIGAEMLNAYELSMHFNDFLGAIFWGHFGSFLGSFFGPLFGHIISPYGVGWGPFKAF